MIHAIDYESENLFRERLQGQNFRLPSKHNIFLTFFEIFQMNRDLHSYQRQFS